MNMKKIFLPLIFSLMPLVAEANPIIIQVKGMVCAFCAQGIEKKFKALPEVSSVKVSLETKLVNIDTKDGKDLPDTQITKIINDAGYDVVKIERKK